MSWCPSFCAKEKPIVKCETDKSCNCQCHSSCCCFPFFKKKRHRHHHHDTDIKVQEASSQTLDLSNRTRTDHNDHSRRYKKKHRVEIIGKKTKIRVESDKF